MTPERRHALAHRDTLEHLWTRFAGRPSFMAGDLRLAHAKCNAEQNDREMKQLRPNGLHRQPVTELPPAPLPDRVPEPGPPTEPPTEP